jgi:hypothetical protein
LTRHNFTAAAIREADARAQGRCEATGPRYGLPPGTRCNADLSVTGRQRDHYPRGAHDPHPETRTASNCVVCCPRCNQWAANHTDKQREQSIKNVSYDEALHRAKMDRKRGVDALDPPKPRGRQGKSKPIPRPKNYKWAKRPMSKRQA